jgi:pyruvate ferredoxin oxidoreductase gamma subunit
MLRIRFHGRGGQGMKTASRILGSAAFHAGFVVQDSPVYGAERRGAPMAAFTRISRESIRERGAIARPDLVVVADDTLLTDTAAQPLAGCDADSTVLINSAKDEVALRQTGPVFTGRLLIADFTVLALEATRTLASLSAALGVAGARLIGLTLGDGLAGLDEELTPHLTPSQRASNVALAQAAFTLASSWVPVQERHGSATVAIAPLAEVTFDPPRVAVPTVYAVGNSPERRTGSWRQVRPVPHQELCTRCRICFVRCPEAAISLGANDYPVVDYDQCKGCLLCVHECPTHALTAEKEAR